MLDRLKLIECTNEHQQGIFLPDNVAIYVGRRFVDFLSSVVGWGIIAALYTTTDTNTAKSSSIRRSSLSRVRDRTSQLSALLGNLDDEEIQQILELERTRMRDTGDQETNDEENELAAIRRFLLRRKLMERERQEAQPQQHRHPPRNSPYSVHLQGEEDLVDCRF